MKVRWPGFLICAILGLVMLVGGLLIPAYLRAVDASVIQKAGRNGPALLEQGQALAGAKKLGAAKMLMRAARAAGIPGWDRLGETVTNQARQYPDALAWGDDSPMENLFGGNAKAPEAGAEPFTDFIIHQENREAALAHLRVSSSSVVHGVVANACLEQHHSFSAVVIGFGAGL